MTDCTHSSGVLEMSGMMAAGLAGAPGGIAVVGLAGAPGGGGSVGGMFSLAAAVGVCAAWGVSRGSIMQGGCVSW